MKKRLFIFFQYLVPQHLLSRFLGLFAKNTGRSLKNLIINQFIKKYGVNMDEALLPDADDYASFNDFFSRELKPGARLIDESKNAIVSPADGVISAIGNIESGRLIQAKARTFSLLNLLGGVPERALVFEEGNFATVYLAPKDYHRVHMSFAGSLKEMVFVPGKLFSVNQTTSENIPELFARNERVVCIFETDIGPMAVILIGAMIVASIETVWAGQVAPSTQKLYTNDFRGRQPPVHIEKGLEMGRFKLGSTVILLFGPGAIEWQSSLAPDSSVQMGQQIASVL